MTAACERKSRAPLRCASRNMTHWNTKHICQLKHKYLHQLKHKYLFARGQKNTADTNTNTSAGTW